MRNRLNPECGLITELKIADFPAGEIAPPLIPDHRTWDILEPWDDPFASREHKRKPSNKLRVEYQGQPALEWQREIKDERALITGRQTWRDYSLECRVQPLQGFGEATFDDPDNTDAWTGLVFRMKTLRHYYMFCIENQRRLVLCRYCDEEKIELAAKEVRAHERILTLRVELDADGIRAACPELEVDFLVTDDTHKTGPAGFRALGQCRLFNLQILMTPGQEQENRRRQEHLKNRRIRLAASEPRPVEAGEISLHNRGIIAGCVDFARKGHHDLLFTSPAGLTAETWTGERLWKLPENNYRAVKWSDWSDPDSGARILYAMVGERRHGKGNEQSMIIQDELIAVNGATGNIEKRIKLPVSPAEERLRHYDVSFNTGRLSGNKAIDVIVREWRKDVGGGGHYLWAYNGDLEQLWQTYVNPPYGHHNAVHFINSANETRSRILAGGTLLDHRGQVLWIHDRAEEMLNTPGGVHYDAAIMGDFAADPELDPSVFMAGGSSGLYVVDGRTGRTRAAHRIGHSQWLRAVKVRDDLPGDQILAGTRWGNYGIITLFSGRGDRLWTIQPDYLGQGSTPLQWRQDGPQHIWVNTSRRAMGLYDGYGRMVDPLEAVRELCESPWRPSTMVLKKTPDGQELMGIKAGDKIRLFGPCR